MGENSKTSIKFWAEDDRPREKLQSKGREALSNAELLAILLGSGNSEDSAVDLAKKILSSVSDNLVELSKLNLKALEKFKGIGQVKAITIVAALELGRRRRAADVLIRNKVVTSSDAFELFAAKLEDLNHEQFWIIMLDNSARLIELKQLSTGGVTGTIVDAKLVFKMALEHGAVSIIVSHNHPSGQLKPSDQDIRITKQLVAAGKTLDINVLDHIIVAGNSYYSFADEGIL